MLKFYIKTLIFFDSFVPTYSITEEGKKKNYTYNKAVVNALNKQYKVLWSPQTMVHFNELYKKNAKRRIALLYAV